MRRSPTTFMRVSSVETAASASSALALGRRAVALEAAGGLRGAGRRGLGRRADLGELRGLAVAEGGGVDEVGALLLRAGERRAVSRAILGPAGDLLPKAADRLLGGADGLAGGRGRVGDGVDLGRERANLVGQASHLAGAFHEAERGGSRAADERSRSP